MHQKRDGFSGILIGIIIAIVLVVIIGIVFIMMKQSGNPSVATPTAPIISTSNSSSNEGLPSSTSTILPSATSSLATVNNELFVANFELSNPNETNGRFLDIWLYAFDSKKVLKYRKIPVDDIVFSSSDDNSVQYNPNNGDIFYSTDSGCEHEMSAGVSTNKDGTCNARIYKTNIDSGNPIVLTQVQQSVLSPNSFSDWLLDTKSGDIYLKTTSSTDDIFWRLDTKSGAMEQLAYVGFDGDGWRSASQLSITEDGTALHEVVKSGGSVFLVSLDLQNNEINKNPIASYSNYYDSCDCALSPDGNYVSYYNTGPLSNPPPSLHIYNVNSGKEVPIPVFDNIANSTLRWSGNSEKLYFQPENLYALDMDSLQADIVGGPVGPSYFPSYNGDYIFFFAVDVGVYDTLKNNIIIKLPFLDQLGSNVVAAHWFTNF